MATWFWLLKMKAQLDTWNPTYLFRRLRERSHVWGSGGCRSRLTFGLLEELVTPWMDRRTAWWGSDKTVGSLPTNLTGRGGSSRSLWARFL